MGKFKTWQIVVGAFLLFMLAIALSAIAKHAEYHLFTEQKVVNTVEQIVTPECLIQE